MTPTASGPFEWTRPRAVAASFAILLMLWMPLAASGQGDDPAEAGEAEAAEGWQSDSEQADSQGPSDGNGQEPSDGSGEAASDAALGAEGLSPEVPAIDPAVIAAVHSTATESVGGAAGHASLAAATTIAVTFGSADIGSAVALALGASLENAAAGATDTVTRTATVVAVLSGLDGDPEAYIGTFMPHGLSERDYVDAQIPRIQHAMLHCYTTELVWESGLSGLMMVRVYLSANGEVRQAQVVQNRTGSDALGDCLSDGLAGLQLDPVGRSNVSISFPVTFRVRD